ncbi:superinfection immunity protein [Sandarakinorhabdus rubra]|uniref:superinfection immunity protein n=1 Tax=Sandarakinorhabdus rubra TaxID=2672568 RepID=UPI0013D9115A|nr:superinfection immunity protein [Sandarakinorhabdus rubra]
MVAEAIGADPSLVSTGMVSIAAWIFVALCVFNFLPAIVAYVDRHPDRRLLAALNILSLFSFALWVALMAWARAGDSSHPLIRRFVGSAQDRRRLFASVALLLLAGSAGTAVAMVAV